MNILEGWLDLELTEWAREAELIGCLSRSAFFKPSQHHFSVLSLATGACGWQEYPQPSLWGNSVFLT